MLDLLKGFVHIKIYKTDLLKQTCNYEQNKNLA